MDKQSIKDLIVRLNSAQASESDMQEAEKLLEAGVISIDDIDAFAELEAQVLRIATPSPSSALDESFHRMLSLERKKIAPAAWRRFFSPGELAPKLAFASLMLIVGLAAGYLLRPATSVSGDPQIQMLSKQVSDLQEMMMLSLLEKGSATERLKAVNLTQEMPEASRKVTNALIQTLNQDENVNVRLAALEALKPYVTDSSVREALIRSIARQESPLVQISLAELMVALQERAAVEEFEKIVESDNTPPAVKKKIRESIEVLI